MFELKMTTCNAAFHDEAGGMPNVYAERGEVIRILDKVREAILHGKSQGFCVDYNGNVVGEWILK